MNRLMIVSNRLPLTAEEKPQGFVLTPSPGGLATGLNPVRQRVSSLWIGWPGDTSRMDPKLRRRASDELAKMGCVPVELSADELEGYYSQFSNAIIWPLFHLLPSHLPYQLDGWDEYLRVNEKFADAIEANYQEGDVIWIHDYHFLLLPQLVRERLPSAAIGFFLHIPFPPSDEFRILPWREKLLNGLLGADLIGFHTNSYANNFTSALLRILGLETRMDQVRTEDGRLVRIGAYPLGVDVKHFEVGVDVSEMEVEVSGLRNKMPEPKLFLSVDRLDYTKGIVHRLLSFERFLENHPDYRRRAILIQIATAPRLGIQAFEDTKRLVDEIVGRVNGRFGEPDYQPIHYISRKFSQVELAHLYRGVDVMVVTPLRDGMNLVAKEFCASRTDGDGVLILSEFAGAHAELGEALIVNPYDIAGTAEAYAQALAMTPGERASRMRALRGRVKLLDNRRWSQMFLSDLETAHDEVMEEEATREKHKQVITPEELAILSSNRNVALCLDYDGTLVPIAARPEQAAPDALLMQRLMSLGDSSRIYPVVISGRSRENVESWLGALPIHLFAEHGLWERPPHGEWRSLLNSVDEEWKEHVREMLERACLEVPGSFVEEKAQSLVWHYRASDPGLSETKARELHFHLVDALANEPLQVMSGKKIVEVRHSAVHKGEAILIISRLFDARNYQIIAIGDDTTDEDMFRYLPEDGLGVKVGLGETEATHYLANVGAVRRYLSVIEDKILAGQSKKAAQWME